MFIISFKINKSRVVMVAAILIILTAVISFGYYILSSREEYIPEMPAAAYNIEESNYAVNFIRELGWQIENVPSEYEEFKFPEQFDTVYKRYAQFQRDINVDLNNYKGKSVKRYTYKVNNYKLPQQYKGQQVFADVIIYDGKVIAGDLKTNEINGFMVSLKGRSFKEITGIEESMFR